MLFLNWFISTSVKWHTLYLCVTYETGQFFETVVKILFYLKIPFYLHEVLKIVFVKSEKKFISFEQLIKRNEKPYYPWQATVNNCIAKKLHFLSIEYFVIVVVVRIFNATRHPRHMEAGVIVMYRYLYSLAFMDHPCTLGATVFHQAPPYPLYTQPRACQV